ncbi:MAG: glutaredoxin family protein [Thermoleophilia bacterium]
MTVPAQHVSGKSKGELRLYALSTCAWCRKTRQLLDELGVEYDLVEVDLVDAQYKDEVMDEVKNWNPDSTFPILVFDNHSCIIGYQADQIRERLK